jgi:hypothetical protein
MKLKPFPQEVVDRLNAEDKALDDPKTETHLPDMTARNRQEGVRKAVQIVMDAWAEWGAVIWPEPRTKAQENGPPAAPQFAATVNGISKRELDGGPAAIELTVLVPWEFGYKVRVGDFLPIAPEPPLPA